MTWRRCCCHCRLIYAGHERVHASRTYIKRLAHFICPSNPGCPWAIMNKIKQSKSEEGIITNEDDREIYTAQCPYLPGHILAICFGRYNRIEDHVHLFSGNRKKTWLMPCIKYKTTLMGISTCCEYTNTMTIRAYTARATNTKLRDTEKKIACWCHFMSNW